VRCPIYNVTGLGDTNYEKFCEAAKSIDELMLARGNYYPLIIGKSFPYVPMCNCLGATRFYPCGWADDGIGLELVVEPYNKGVMATFNKMYNDEVEATRVAAVNVLATQPNVLQRIADDPSLPSCTPTPVAPSTVSSSSLSSSPSPSTTAAATTVLSSSSVDGDAKVAEYYFNRDEAHRAEVKRHAAEANPQMSLLETLQQQKHAVEQANRRTSSIDITPSHSSSSVSISSVLSSLTPISSSSSVSATTSTSATTTTPCPPSSSVPSTTSSISTASSISAPTSSSTSTPTITVSTTAIVPVTPTPTPSVISTPTSISTPSSAPTTAIDASLGTGSATAATTTNAKVGINTATLEQLMMLPKIGNVIPSPHHIIIPIMLLLML
jgi:DNA uptake protein ComE-like DNA-binding protein